MEEIAQPHFVPTPAVSFREGVMEGRGTNAPSSGSAVDFAMNNPYAFKSNFNGGSLGAASSGSASDYYDSNPNRVPSMQSETRHYSEFMMEGGAIDWAKYLGYIKKGISKIPDIIEKAPAFIDKTKKTLDTIKELRDTLKPGYDVVEKAIKSRRKHAPAHEELEYEEEPEEEYTKISRRVPHRAPTKSKTHRRPKKTRSD